MKYHDDFIWVVLIAMLFGAICVGFAYAFSL